MSVCLSYSSFCKAFVKAFDASSCINEGLLSGIKRMAVVADIDLDGRTC